MLEKLYRSEVAAHRNVVRARALLMAADGFANTRIAKEVGVSRATVTAWRERFEQEGLKASVPGPQAVDRAREGR